MTRVLLGLFLAAAVAVPARADILLSDDFSSSNFNSGDLAGQQSWSQLGTSATNPIQIQSGRVVIPAVAAGAGGDDQDVSKDFSSVAPPASGQNSVFVGMTLRVDASARNPSYFMALTDTPGGFANERVAAGVGTADGTFALAGRVTGQGGYPYVYGGDLMYGKDYTVVVEAGLVAGTQNDYITLYVAPMGTAVNMATPYLTETYSGTGSGNDPASLGTLIISQYSSASTSQSGLSIGAIRVATTFGEAASVAAVPEPASLALIALGALPLVVAARRRARRA